MARDIIGNENFIEVYVNASLAVCEKRDTKGLYQKARAGEIRNFTGIGAPFEPPEHPDIELKTDTPTIAESVAQGLEKILPLIQYKKFK